MIVKYLKTPALQMLLSAILVAAFPLHTINAQNAEKEQIYRQKLVPMLQDFCMDCHDSGSPEGDFNLAAFKNSQMVLENRQTWLKLMQRVSFGDMPPEDGEEMSEGERKKMLDVIDELINKIDCSQQIDPGQVTIRRLNRFEYRNTIRDLLGVDYTPAKSFPGDDVGYGFDNIGDVLSLPTLLMEKYLAAAEEISLEAIPNTSVQQEAVRLAIKGSEFDIDDGKGGPDGKDGMIISSEGQATKRFFVPESGKYQFKLYAYGQLAGDELPLLSFGFDGKEKKRLKVSEPVSKPKEIKMVFRLAKGDHQMAVAFLNDHYNRKAPKGKQDRNLGVSSLTITGPIDRKAQRREDGPELLFVRPKSSDELNEASYAVLQRLASRAYRRPASKEEIRRLQRIVAMVIKDGGTYDDGMRLALQAILVSPHFLFKIEQPPEGDAIRELNDYELAVSLSYFIWNSMPDDQLFRVSFRKKMRDGSNLDDEIARMLKDEKAQAMIENFGLQWLQLRNLEDIDPDKSRFPNFDNDLRKAMRRETELLLKEIVKNDMSIFTLLTANFTFVNEKLADHYDLLNVKGDEFRKVTLAGTNRRGLLSHASILTITSNPTRTSPVKRGKWVLENLLGAPPPPPAPDVMPLEDQELTGSLREQMKQHRENPACASCHAEMDPIGFALENFDAVGRWRKDDDGSSIDPVGKLPDGTSFNGAIELQEILSKNRRENFARCFAEKMLTYALGRGLDYYDQCAVDKIMESAAKEDYRYSAFVRAVVNSDPFQKRRNRRIQE